MAETGLPGSPKTGVAESARTPKANGFAGRMATCIQRIFPALSFSSTTRTRSRSPTLTPPLVRMASQVDAAEDKHLHQGSLVVPDDPEVDAVPSLAADQGQKGVAVGVADLARGERTGSREELVAGGEHPDPWPGMHRHTLHSLIGQHAQVRRSEHGSRRSDDVADGHIAARLADEVAPLRAARPMTTLRPSGSVSVSSIMQTASAPGGTGAPVMMRAA